MTASKIAHEKTFCIKKMPKPQASTPTEDRNLKQCVVKFL